MVSPLINIGSSPNDGTGEALRSAFDKINDGFDEVRNLAFINVEDYLQGESVDGVTDNTATVARAYAALSATNGGTLYFTPQNWKFNLVNLKPNVTISGQSHLADFTGTLTSRFIPADTTRPVIQIGNDTGLVKGFVIRDCTIDGRAGGDMGVYFAGGAFECSMQDCAVTYFTTGIKVQGGTAYPASLIYFNRVHGNPNLTANNARGIHVLNPANYPTSWTTEIDFSDCHWNGPSAGTNSYVMEIDSCEVKISNVYYDVHDGHGIKLSHNVTTPLPLLDAINSNLDGGSGSAVVIEGYTNDRNFTGLSGINFQINGSWKELDGTVIAPLPQQIRTILRKSSAVRGSLLLLNQGAGDGTSVIQFRDQINNKNPDIFAQNGSLNFRPENGAAIKVVNLITGTSWWQVNGTDGATFLTGAGTSATTIPYLDSNRQLKSSAVTPTELGYLSGVTSPTGSGALVLSTSPTITTPTLSGTTQINSPAGQSISVLNFFDVLNSKTADIRGQLGSLLLRSLSGQAVKITDSTGASMFQVNGADGSTFCFGAGFTANTSLYLDSNRQLKSLLVTNTAAGTTGAQTIHKPLGRVNFAAGAQTLVVTNSFVATTSNIQATIKADDTTAKSVVVSAQSAGSFTLKLNANATAETAVDFFVINGV